MPVVINELEVVPREPASAATNAASAPVGRESSECPSPDEMAGMVARQAERLERVRAY
ncbi:MAG: hypothetical protein OEV70_13360 [Nitrospirota bacterium]|nr:hypothetical protein [Nitrospirota bacterium]